MSPPNLAEALTPQRLHAELLATGALGAWSYLFGAAHDATISSRHNTVRFGQAGVEWLAVLRSLLEERGQRAWMYRFRRTEQISPTCGRSLKKRGLPVGSCTGRAAFRTIWSGGSMLQLPRSGISCPAWGLGIQGSAVCWWPVLGLQQPG